MASEHADPALRRLAVWASTMENHCDCPLKLTPKGQDELAADLARALQRLAALEAVQARVLDRIGALRETYHCGSDPWIAVNTAQLDVASMFIAARVLAPEEGG